MVGVLGLGLALGAVAYPLRVVSASRDSLRWGLAEVSLRAMARRARAGNWQSGFVALSIVGAGLLVAPGVLGRSQTQFRTAVDVVRVDVRVLDRRTRLPMPGLGMDDFRITVAGERQSIVSVQGRATSADAGGGPPSEVVNNDLGTPRLIAIVMDDISVATVPYNMNKARQVASRIIDSLEPNDMAAVIFTQDNRHAQDFTRNRDLLRAAVSRYRAWPVGIGCELPSAMILGTVRRTVEFLATHAPERAAVFFVSQAPPRCGKEYFIDWSRGALVQRSSISGNAPPQSHVTVPIHAISVAGLEAPVEGQLFRPAPAGGALGALAANSGGRHVFGSNAPEQVVPAIFREMSAYYLLGYTPTYPLDGRLRWLDVSVSHPDAMVLPGARAFAAPQTNRNIRSDVMPDRLTEAISAAIPNGPLPLRLATSVVRHQSGAVAIAVLGADLSTVETVASTAQLAIDIRVFDWEGRREVSAVRRQASVPIPSGPESRFYEIATRLDLRPGRYAVRAGASVEGTELSGGVFTTIVVPDFEKEPLTLSDVAIGRVEGRPVGGRDAVDGVLPFAPTTVREFLPSERVGAFVTIHQSGNHAATPVTITTRIGHVGGNEADVFNQTRVVPASAFLTRQGAIHAFDVPLAMLPAGLYRLVFDAIGADGARSSKNVLFSVR